MEAVVAVVPAVMDAVGADDPAQRTLKNNKKSLVLKMTPLKK